MRRHSAAKKTPKPKTEIDYTLDDLELDVCNLCALLDVAVSGLCNIVLTDLNLGERGKHTQATALAWVARDLADQVKEKIEAGGGRPRV
jgi:hypothetical protein